jgi:hypothetical protein
MLAAALQSVLASGGNRTGTGGAAQLQIPIGARDLAMGGATISTSSGIEALYWNPAGIAKSSTGASLMFSHMSYIADIGVDYGAASANFEGLGTFALSIKSLSIGEMLVTTTQNPDGTGQTYSPQFFVAGATFAKQLSDRISVGVTANLVSERIAEVSSSGVAFNVGVMYENLGSINGLSLGVAVKNVGPQMKYDGPGLYASAAVPGQNRGANLITIEAAPYELPSTIEFGLGYHYAFSGNNALQISGTFQNNNFSGDEYRGGVEYGYNNNFFVRAGYSGSPASQSDDYIYGLTAGAGVAYDFEGTQISFDYAFRSVKYFDGNHIISIKLGF